VRQHPAPGHDPLETMTQEDYRHPITPPPELLTRWENDWFNEREHADVLLVNAYAAGAQAGADQELKACCEWLTDWDTCEGERLASLLREGRRPKPPSLKEQALAELEKVDMLWDTTEFSQETLNSLDTIRRALEQLDD
jgi:hypothetical protein